MKPDDYWYLAYFLVATGSVRTIEHFRKHQRLSKTGVIVSYGIALIFALGLVYLKEKFIS